MLTASQDGGFRYQAVNVVHLPAHRCIQNIGVGS